MTTTIKKEPTAETTGAAPVEVATVQDLSLQEFCQRLSLGNNKRVELIGAFHQTETAAGKVKDTESAFQARFDEFINKPVEG